MEYWTRKVRAEDEDRYWEKFGRQMGTIWYRSDFETEGDGNNKTPKNLKDPNTAFYPHSLLASPNNVWKQIQKDFASSKPQIAGGDYRPVRGEKIVETSDMSHDEFRDFFAKFGQGLGVDIGGE